MSILFRRNFLIGVAMIGGGVAPGYLTTPNGADDDESPITCPLLAMNQLDPINMWSFARGCEANGERFIVCSESLWLKEIGENLHAAYPDRGVPTRELPNWITHLMSRFNPTLKLFLPNLGRQRNYNTAKARETLGIDFIPAKDAILASTASAIELNMLQSISTKRLARSHDYKTVHKRR